MVLRLPLVIAAEIRGLAAMSLGHWSRTELVRSFVRSGASGGVFPTVYEARFHCAGAGAPQAVAPAVASQPARPSTLSQRSEP